LKISIALCTYNGEKYIVQQLKSILKQTHLPHEIVISDDASTDETINLVLQTIGEQNKIEIKILRNQQTLRTIKNFEKAVTNCSGDWIFLCDQDDIWMPNKIECMVNHVIANRKLKLLFSNGYLINSEGTGLGSTLWDEWKFTKEKQLKWSNPINVCNDLLDGRNYVTGATVFFKRTLLRKGIPITVPSGYYHDAWFAFHAAARNGLGFIDDCLINYRLHPLQQVGITAGSMNSAPVINQNNISFPKLRQQQYINYPMLYLKLKIYKLFNLLSPSKD
jgi:glycosyltransferase involved in cell wall biosynthesis